LIAVPQLPMAILDMSHLWPKSLDLGVIDAGSLFSHSNPLVAGVILLVSLFFASVFGRVVISLGALVAFAGHLLFVPSVVSVPAYQVAILAGVAIGIVGMALSPPKKV